MKLLGTGLLILARIGCLPDRRALMLLQLIVGLFIATFGATMANMLVQFGLVKPLGDTARGPIHSSPMRVCCRPSG